MRIEYPAKAGCFRPFGALMSFARRFAVPDCVRRLFANPRYFELAVAALQRFPQAAAAYGLTAVIVGADDGRQLGWMGCVHSGSARPAPGCNNDAAGIPMQFIPPQEALSGLCFSPYVHSRVPDDLAARLLAELGLGYYNEALGPQSDYFFTMRWPPCTGRCSWTRRSPPHAYRTKLTAAPPGDDDFFRCYALVEKRIRALPLPYETDERLWAQFRTATIASRTAEFHQRRLFKTVRGYCNSVPPAELQMFPSEPGAFVAKLQEECARLETKLNSQIERARQIFNEVAGPVEPLPLGSESGPRPWLRPLAEFFLSLGKILGKTFTGVGNWLWQA